MALIGMGSEVVDIRFVGLQSICSSGRTKILLSNFTFFGMFGHAVFFCEDRKPVYQYDLIQKMLLWMDELMKTRLNLQTSKHHRC